MTANCDCDDMIRICAGELSEDDDESDDDANGVGFGDGVDREDGVDNEDGGNSDGAGIRGFFATGVDGFGSGGESDDDAVWTLLESVGLDGLSGILSTFLLLRV